MNNKIVYNIPGTLEDVLHVADEVRSITGLEAAEIVTDDQQRIKFNKTDLKMLSAGSIDVEKYISRNRIS